VAFAFLYAAIDGIIEPYSWIDYFPQFLTSIAPALTLLHLFAALEIVIALWLLWGRYAFYPAALASVLLVGIVLFNLGEFQLLFRDLSIASASLALAVDAWYQ
jgi:hypothetical protein